MKSSLQIILLLTSLLTSVLSQKFEYLSDLNEGDDCLLSEYPQILGKCVKTASCQNEFERHRNNDSVIKICKFNPDPRNNIICCRDRNIYQNFNNHKRQEFFTHFRHDDYDLFDIETCRERFLSIRKRERNVDDLVDAILSGKRKPSVKDCDNIKTIDRSSFNIPKIKSLCNRTPLVPSGSMTVYGNQVELGDWQNMAAVGWTQNDGKIEYNCGGVIISHRFILTAAHCRYKGKNPDTIRVGDRYLDLSDDDMHSQQLTVEIFIPHPEYKSLEVYNDIAVIKTVEKIFFHKYVGPACIADFNENSINSKWKIAGYGKTEFTDKPYNVLLEISIHHVPTSNCSDYYEDNPRISKGLLSSHICTIGNADSEGNIPDSCNGDSGSPLQYKEFYEIRDPDYDRTLLKTVYEIPITLGLVSFGTPICGFNIPSVNTNIYSYREWIQSVLNNNRDQHMSQSNQLY